MLGSIGVTKKNVNEGAFSAVLFHAYLMYYDRDIT